MSTPKIILEIEADAVAAVTWLETQAAAGLAAVAGLVRPIITAAEPTVIADVKAAVEAFLTAAGHAGSIDDLEQDFLEMLESAGSALLEEAVGLEGPILQAIIALVKAA